MVSYILLLFFSQWAAFTFCGDPNFPEEQADLEYAQAYQAMYLGGASDPKAEKDSSIVEQDLQVGT